MTYDGKDLVVGGGGSLVAFIGSTSRDDDFTKKYHSTAHSINLANP